MPLPDAAAFSAAAAAAFSSAAARSAITADLSSCPRSE
jgi:hypothetical protein